MLHLQLRNTSKIFQVSEYQSYLIRNLSLIWHYLRQYSNVQNICTTLKKALGVAMHIQLIIINPRPECLQKFSSGRRSIERRAYYNTSPHLLETGIENVLRTVPALMAIWQDGPCSRKLFSPNCKPHLSHAREIVLQQQYVPIHTTDNPTLTDFTIIATEA